MALTQGDVRITIGVTGKGDTKVIKDAQKDVEGLGAKLGTSMKTSVDPVNKLREGFERVRANAGFLVGSLTALGGVVVGVVGEIISFVSGADKADRALVLWEKNQNALTGAIEKGRDALVQFGGSPVEQALSDVNTQLTIARGLLIDMKDNEEEWAKKTKEVEKLLQVRTALENDLARDAERTADAWDRIKRSMQEAATIDFGTAQGPNPFIANSDDPALKLQRNEFGELETEAEKEARLKRLGLAVRDNRARRGGGKRLAEQRGDFYGQTFQPSNDDGLSPEFIFFAKNPVDDGDRTDTADGSSSGGKGKSRAQMLAGDVRDFTAALSESIPQMGEFASALGQISAMWGEYAETGKGAARATIMSVGAIAQAGAEQIKNERMRAGVLSIIHLGLGTALMFVPGAQQEAVGHLAGAAILGSVAIFGGGGGGSSKQAPRAVNRQLSERGGEGGVTMNFWAPYIAGNSAQETAAELHALQRRGTGSGFVPAG